jgi:hypothetical protein
VKRKSPGVPRRRPRGRPPPPVLTGVGGSPMGLRSAGLGSGGSGRNLAALIGGAWNGLPISGPTMPARAGGKRAGWGRRGAPGAYPSYLLTPTDTLLTGGVSACKLLKYLIFIYLLTCWHPFRNMSSISRRSDLNGSYIRSWLRDRKLGSFIGALHDWSNCGHDPQGGPVHPVPTCRSNIP